MKKWQISLKTAAALAFLAVAAIPVWLAWELPQSEAIRLERERAERTHQTYTDAIAMSLKGYHARIEAGFTVVADDLARAGGEPVPERAQTMDALGLNHVCVYDVVTNTLEGANARAGMPCPETPTAEYLNAIRTLAVDEQMRISGVQEGPTGMPALLLVRRSGAAATIGSLDTRQFRELAETVRFGEYGHAAILDHTGRVLAHPDPTWVNPPMDMSGLDIVQMILDGGSGTSEFYSDAMKADMVSAYASVEGPGWGILVNQPEREMKFIVTEIKRGTFKVLLIALAIAAALAMLAAHLLIGPITRIRLAAERLGSGEGVALIPPTGAGSRLTEINDLRAAFNAMVLRIRRSHRTEIAARREAQEATRTKSRFLANMSHELRTPLNAIIGFAEVTKRRMTGLNTERDRDREYLGYIHDSGIHLLSIINDLLDLSRIEAGAWLLDEEDVDVSKAIRDSRAMLGTMPEDKKITIMLKGIDKAIMLWADRRAVRQMLLNLTTNAVRYTQDGGTVVIGCAIGEGGSISLVVEDNGPGIAAEELMKVRAPFTRGRAHETAAIPGTGLGLSIVDALADLHDARFDLTSEMGRGTRAKVTFPPNRTLLTLVGEATRNTAT